MSDMELIMQLARLESQEDEDKLGEDGVINGGGGSGDDENGQRLSNNESIKSNQDFPTSSSHIVSEIGIGSDSKMIKNSIGSANLTTNDGHEELQALADLEKELGLDDLQLFLDSTSSPDISSFKSPEGKSGKSNISMGVETGGSVTSFNTAVTGFNTSQKVDNIDDDDNLDELERYLESLSAPTPNK